ncbi:MAG TPA: extracellular solute-binding protein [Rectinemataceae bacterium]|nr:extracellular solute-binding protein [Rectinemataceae bacterium]
MKKVIIALLMVAVTFGAMAQVTLNVLNYQQADQAGYQQDVQIWQDFQTQNPDIKLNMEVLFNDPYHQKLQAYAAAGTLPDVFYIWPGARSAVIHEKHLAKDLGSLLGPDYLKDFTGAATNPNNQLGKYLAELPQSFTYTSVMYVNVKLLKDNGFAVPKTYADLRKMVPKLKAKGIAVMMLPDKDGWPGQSCLFSTVAGRMAGDKFFDDVLAGKAKFTDAPFVNSLKVVESFFKDGIIQRTDTSIGYGEGAGLFAQGKAAIYLDGDWRTGAYITDKASGKALIDPADQPNYALLNLVALPGEKNAGVTSAVAGTGWAVSGSLPAGSDKEKAAVRLIKYLYSPEVQSIRYSTGAYVPTRKGVKADLEPLPSMLPAFYAANPKTCYVLDGVLDPSVYNVINNGIINIGNGTETAVQVASEVQKAYEAWKSTQK